MNSQTTVMRRILTRILRKIDEERTKQDAKSRSVSRTAIVLDALAASLVGKPGVAVGAVQ